MTTLAPLDTPDKLARFIALMGYPRRQILDAVRRDFPDADAEKVADAAIAHATSAP